MVLSFWYVIHHMLDVNRTNTFVIEMTIYAVLNLAKLKIVNKSQGSPLLYR